MAATTMLKRWVLVGILALTAAAAPPQQKIKHFVTVMLENRAFDHRIGLFKHPGMEGVPADAYNMLNGTSCKVSNKGLPFDTPNAGHSYKSTINEQYGTIDIKPPYPKPPMSGFALNEHSCNVMDCIDPSHMPVTETILKEFAVVDRYFAGFPGPTEVNRLFWHATTNGGYCDNPSDDVYVEGFKMESLLHRLEQQNISAKVYMEDDVSTTLFFRDQRTLKALEKYHGIDQFEKDAAAGQLPQYSVIEPRYFAVPGKPADDEHPASHSIYQGELLYKRIYDTLRAGPAWNETALLIIYDEHGGLYDHVASPTTGVPSPTPGLSCIYGGDKYYDFSRLGVRLPAFLISPWVSPGQVIHAPQGPAAPAKTSQYTHSSVSRTLHDLYGLEGSLTARDAWAGSFAPILTETLPAPRSDCPAAMPEPPAPSEETRQRLGQEWTQPLNDWQVSLVRSYAALNGQTWDDRAAAAPVYGLKTEYEGQLWMRRQLAAFKARLAAEAEAGEAAV